ncbi:MAG: hypothetical protein ACK5UD_14215, partial [Planctomyces sp.]
MLNGIFFNALLVLVLGLVVWRYTVKRRLLDNAAAETQAAAVFEQPAGVRELSAWGNLNFEDANRTAAQQSLHAQPVSLAAVPQPAALRTA